METLGRKRPGSCQIGATVQGVGGRRGAQRVRAEAFPINSRRLSVFSQDAVVNGPVDERLESVSPALPGL
jgi:hypothetical protein